MEGRIARDFAHVVEAGLAHIVQFLLKTRARWVQIGASRQCRGGRTWSLCRAAAPERGAAVEVRAEVGRDPAAALVLVHAGLHAHLVEHEHVDEVVALHLVSGNTCAIDTHVVATLYPVIRHWQGNPCCCMPCIVPLSHNACTRVLAAVHY